MTRSFRICRARLRWSSLVLRLIVAGRARTVSSERARVSWIAAFAGQAETINKYLTKGRPVFVEGRLDFDTWTAQDGSKRSKHRITVEGFQFLGGNSGGGSTSASSAEPRQAETGAQYDQSDNQAEPAAASDDDIPF